MRLFLIISLACFWAFTAHATSELNYGNILQVYFLERPVASFNSIVAAVNYPDQVFVRQDVYLARVENGKIIERGAANDSDIHHGFVTTKTREFSGSARVGEDKRNYVSGELAVYGKLVLVYEDNMAKILHKPTAEILISEGGYGFDPKISVSGKISGKRVTKQAISSTADSLISRAPTNGMVFRFPGGKAFSLRKDGSRPGNALVVLPGKAVRNTITSFERGASRFNAGSEYLGRDTRVVLGVWTKDGIVARDVIRGLLTDDQFYIADHAYSPKNRLLIDLKKCVVMTSDSAEIAIKASKGTVSSRTRDESVFKYAATEEQYRNAIPSEDEPIQPRILSKCALALGAVPKRLETD